MPYDYQFTLNSGTPFNTLTPELAVRQKAN